MPDIWGQTLDPLGVNQKPTTHLWRQAEVIFIKKMRNIPTAGLDGEADSYEGLIKFDEFIKNGLMVENKALENRDGTVTSLYINAANTGRLYRAPTATTGTGLNLTTLGSNPFSTSGAISQTSNLATAYRNLYFQITAGASINTPVDPGSGLSLIPNQDVSTISVDSSTLGPSSASITIRNPQNKYVHKRHPLYIGRSVFESEDIVYINLPGLDGQLYRTFTGFVTTVSVETTTEGGTIQNYIVIECEDMMKRLRETRTNVKPGFIPAEARRNVSPYNISFAGKLAHEIMAEVCAYAYCDFESISGIYDQLYTFRKNSVVDANTAATQEFGLLDQYTKLPIGTTAQITGPLLAQASLITPASLGVLPNTPAPPSAGVAAISTAYRLAGRQEGASTNAFFITTGTLTTQAVQNVQVNSQTAPGAAVTPTTVTLSTAIPKQVFGFKSASNPSGVQNDSLAQAVNQAVPINGVTNQFPIDDLAFVLEGTSQPAFSITFSAFGLDQFVSEWQSALEVTRTIADTIGFELFTTPEGVLWFRPLNVFLPADVPPGTTTDKVMGQQPRVGTEYWLDRNFIKHESYTETDRDIYTVCVTLGYWDWQNLNVGLENFRPGIVVDSLRFQKYGARYAPRQSKLELTDKSATEAWSRAFLNRANAKASRGSVE